MKIGFQYNLPDINCRIESALFNQSIRLKYDTGADVTCISASFLKSKMTEAEFTGWMQTNNNLSYIKDGILKQRGLVAANLKGINNKSENIKAYAFQVDNLIITQGINQLELKSVPIFVTFDDRFDTPLLGRDIISLINTNINTDDKYLDLNISNHYE